MKPLYYMVLFSSVLFANKYGADRSDFEMVSIQVTKKHEIQRAFYELKLSEMYALLRRIEHPELYKKSSDALKN